MCRFFLDLRLAVALVTLLNCPGLESLGANDDTYLYSPEKVTWSEARLRCEAMGYPMASPRDEAENTQLVDFIKTTVNSEEDVWLGGYLDSWDTWRWSEGAAIQWFDWSADNGQPNDLQKEKCLRVRTRDDKWWNKECNDTFPFLCQTDSVREASFGLLDRDKSPVETPLKTFFVSSGPECTLRCMEEFRCKLYSVQMTSPFPSSRYLCSIFSSDQQGMAYEQQTETRLYFRHT